MSRRQPVAFFLGDVGFLSDAKFRKLARLLPDPDDFNSAVGAYWIALASSRRNGSPRLDVHDETETRWMQQLVEAGLVDTSGFPETAWKEWTALSPQQVAAGRARASAAERDEHGHFTKSTASESSALDDTASAVQPSPPVPSTQLPTKGGAGENEPATAQANDTWRLWTGLTGKARPSPNVIEWLTRLEDAHTSAAVAKVMRDEWAIEANPRTLLGRVETTLEKAAHTAERESQRDKHTERIQRGVWARRIEQYRFTGYWEAEWGEKPDAQVSAA